jgi:hypothetical protein
MASPLIEIFKDNRLMDRIGKRLPFLFQIAELESSRAGKVGMEVGSLREKILIALLIHKFGEENVETQISITEPEVDVKLLGRPISIKTITGTGGVKFSWTVDAQKAQEFVSTYTPKADILLVQIKWNGTGKFFYIPIEAQQRIFRSIGRSRYFKLPKPGTNPRGVEVSKECLSRLMEDQDTKSMTVVWRRSKIEYSPYQRWVDYWSEEQI